jgi:hypothetical protein
MTAVQAWREGMRRVASAPAVLAGVWLMTALTVLPLTLALRDQLATHLGSSLIAEDAADGVSHDWMQEFADRATGFAVTFNPTILGLGAVLENFSAFLDRTGRPIAIAAAAGAYILLWLLAAGGIFDRYARNRPTRAAGFFAASGVFFFRFLRLAIVMLAFYGALFAYLHPWLFDRVYVDVTREMTVERTVFLVRVALYAGFGLALAAGNLVFDYAKARAVVEDRRSMLGAIVAAARFVWRNARAVAALYLLDAVLLVAAVAAYGVVAPGAGPAGWRAWLGFGIGQLYVLARVWVKLVFWASEVALFQGRLAHAGYVAAPTPVWPESPSVEALRNLS